MLLAEDLAWTPHIHAVCSKAHQVLGLLYHRFYNFSNADALLQLYVSMVRPHLEYTWPVWAHYTAKDILELERVQRFAGRMATCTHNWNSSYSELQSIVLTCPAWRKRWELKLSHLLKIFHKFCAFSQMTSSDSGSKLSQLVALAPFVLFVYNNHLLTQILIYIHLCHMQFLSGTHYHGNSCLHHHSKHSKLT